MHETTNQWQWISWFFFLNRSRTKAVWDSANPTKVMTICSFLSLFNLLLGSQLYCLVKTQREISPEAHSNEIMQSINWYKIFNNIKVAYIFGTNWKKNVERYKRGLWSIIMDFLKAELKTGFLYERYFEGLCSSGT